MKSGKRKRWLSAMLVLVMVMAMNISVLAAPEENTAENEAEIQALTEPVTDAEQHADMGAELANQGIATYADINPDANYILVGKTFRGITVNQIPAEFQIQVTNQSGTPYTLDSSNVISRGADGLTWQWRIDNAAVGVYSVTESGAEVPGYSLATSGTGADVEVKAADFKVTSDVYTECSHTNWPVKIDGDQNVLFAAALTGKDGCVVISKTPLTASQRATVTAAVTGIGGNWKTPVNFYSISTNGNGPYTVQGKSLRYNPDTEEVILANTSNWSHVATLNYSISAASNPDISITNTYTPTTTSVEIQKLITGNIGDRNEEFGFTVNCTEAMEAGEGYTLSADKKTATFALGHEDKVMLNGVRIGSTLTISESGATDYKMTIKVGNITLGADHSYTIPVGATGPVQIIVENHREGTIDTGVALDSLPYILILAVVAAGVVAFIRKRRRHNGN